MSTDAIVMLKDDHQEIRRLFRDLQAAGKNATATKGKLATRIIEKLTVHTLRENEVMYPEVRTVMPEIAEGTSPPPPTGSCFSAPARPGTWMPSRGIWTQASMSCTFANIGPHYGDMHRMYGEAVLPALRTG